MTGTAKVSLDDNGWAGAKILDTHASTIQSQPGFARLGKVAMPEGQPTIAFGIKGNST